MSTSEFQLERFYHRLLAALLLVPIGGALAAVWACVAYVFYANRNSLHMVESGGVVAVALVVSGLLLLPLWGGLRDVFVGYVVRLDARQISWPQLPLRQQLDLHDIAEVVFADKGGDLVLVTKSGSRRPMKGTGALRRKDLDNVADAIRQKIT